MGTGFIILFVLAFVISLILGFREASWDIGLGILMFAISLVISAFVILFIGGVSFLNIETEVTDKPSQTIRLEALKDNTNLSGRFFLGSGTIDEQSYYYYLVKEEQGIKQKKLSVGSAYLNYTDEQPYIEVYDVIPSGWYGKFMFGTEEPFDQIYKIYVPEGSITNEFNVDLE